MRGQTVSVKYRGPCTGASIFDAYDGYIINVDCTEVKNHAAQLQRVGNNINQVVKRMNQTGSLYKTDVAEVKKLLHDIWVRERRLLSKSRY